MHRPHASSRLHELAARGFWRKENWLAELCEILFKVKSRGSSIQLELYFGVIHFVSCSYALVVIPQQLVKAGYSSRESVVTTAICSGLGSILCGLVANLPFVIAPPTVVSIYLVVFLREETLNYMHGNAAVIASGAVLMLFGYKPLTNLVGKLIPLPIQVGTAVGIGLLTALAGALEIKLVQSGQYTMLTRGVVSPEVVIAISGVVMISAAIHYHVRGAFCLGLICCTLAWWVYTGEWPDQVFSMPAVNVTNFSGFTAEFTPPLAGDMVFLYVLYLSGIITSLSELGKLSEQGRDGADAHAPRTRWVYVISGLMTVISGFLCGPPILISPESAAGIKAGAKTGLSTLVCGCLFLVSVYFADVFQHVPHAGTSPVLLMIGTLLFQNVNRIDWTDIKDAAPAFCVLFFIPFMYSVVEGVTVGYYVYLLVGLFTGDLLYQVMFGMNTCVVVSVCALTVVPFHFRPPRAHE
jgi:AGZA family xanthine/uracil permease-like MFS transporter